MWHAEMIDAHNFILSYPFNIAGMVTASIKNDFMWWLLLMFSTRNNFIKRHEQEIQNPFKKKEGEKTLEIASVNSLNLIQILIKGSRQSCWNAFIEIIQDAFNIQKRGNIFFPSQLLLLPICSLFSVFVTTTASTNNVMRANWDWGEEHGKNIPKNENENVLLIKLCKSFSTQLFSRHGSRFISHFSLLQSYAWGWNFVVDFFVNFIK